MRARLCRLILWATVLAACTARNDVGAVEQPQPDQSSWSEARKAGYARAVSAGLGEPVSTLRLPRLDLTVPIYRGTVSSGQIRYRVSSIHIVDPLDLSPLEPSTAAVLTLITCHPFDYQGYAPDRYIVRAVREGGR